MEQKYNEEGFLIAESGSGGEKKKVIHDEEGRIINMRILGEKGAEEWDYEYDEEGDMLKEVYTVKGTLVQITIYTGEDTWYKDIYKDGRVFLRVYYEKEEKVKEEFFN